MVVTSLQELPICEMPIDTPATKPLMLRQRRLGSIGIPTVPNPKTINVTNINF